MSNYCDKGHWEAQMTLPCKQCEIEALRQQLAESNRKMEYEQLCASELEQQLDAAEEKAAHVKEIEIPYKVRVVEENWRKKLEAKDVEIAELSQQVMLLHGVMQEVLDDVWLKTSHELARKFSEALAATDDLDQYILCEKEPIEAIALEDCVEHSHRVYGLGLFAINDAVVTLYRAKE